MKNNVIHIINLNNFLEHNRLAQYLLSHNKTMEPNMEFKIWTEEDQDIKDALALCKDSWSPEFRAGIFIPAYILYKHGGAYCEMDYEFLRLNYFYNAFLENKQLYESPLYDNLTPSSGNVSFFPTKNSSILKRLLDLYLSMYLYGNEWPISHFDSAIKSKLFTAEELDNLKKDAHKNFTYIREYIFHFNNLRDTDGIIICSLSQFNKKFYNTSFYRKYKYYIYVDDKTLYQEKPQLVETTIPYWHTLFYDLERLKECYNIVKEYADKKIIVMDKSLIN